MLIRQTSLMDLYYDPQSDIMCVRWPEIEKVSESEREENFRLIRESVSSYCISLFLLDAHLNTSIPDTERLREALASFFGTLADTGLKKLARIASRTDEREVRAARVFQETSFLGPKELQFEMFTTEQEAVKWLQAEPQD